MMEDFVYWRHPTLPGIKVEEVSEGNDYAGKAWLDMARQIYCENGKEEYREIGHFSQGAPFLYNSSGRISVTHCKGLFAVATLPDTPEVTLGEYSERAALGIDAERCDREQVLRIRDRFLNDNELAMIPAEDVTANILAWTVKEACYKAVLADGLDWRKDINIERMPKFGPPTPVYDKKEFDYQGTGEGFTDEDYGRATVVLPDGTKTELMLFSYMSDDAVVTLAFHRHTARFSKKHQ